MYKPKRCYIERTVTIPTLITGGKATDCDYVAYYEWGSCGIDDLHIAIARIYPNDNYQHPITIPVEDRAWVSADDILESVVVDIVEHINNYDIAGDYDETKVYNRNDREWEYDDPIIDPPSIEELMKRYDE